MKRDYSMNVDLNHNEQVARINIETGEINVLKKRANNIPKGKELFKYVEFQKVNAKAIRFLETVLSNEELGIVFKMIQRADFETNVLVPLSDESSYREIADEFNINKDKVKRIFSKLFDLGVYAQVRVANGLHSEYWTLNPFIAWKGKFIEPTIKVYFSDTILTKASI